MSVASHASVENASQVQESTPICSSGVDLRTCRSVLADSFGRRPFIGSSPYNDDNVQNSPAWYGGEEFESSCFAECGKTICSETQKDYEYECLLLLTPALNTNKSERFWNYPRYASVLGVVSEDKPWEDAGGVVKDADRSSLESSSIGASSSCTSEDESEVQSTHPGALNNLSSLQEALPCKRGLSRFYAGKSRSYTCLSGVTSAKDIAKPLNPYAKRRRYFPYLDKVDRWQSGTIQDGLCGLMRRKHGKVTLSPTLAAQENAMEAKEKACFLVPSRSYSLTDLHTRSMSSLGTLAGYSR